MPRPDEGLIHAWLDGELDAAEAARVAKLVETDAEWGAAAAEARGLIAASSRILGQLDVVAGDVIPKGAPAAPVAPAGDASVRDLGEARLARDERRPRRAVPTWLRVAAVLVFVAGIGYVGMPKADVAEVAVAPTAAETDLSQFAQERVASESEARGAAATAAPTAAPTPAATGAAGQSSPSAIALADPRGRGERSAAPAPAVPAPAAAAEVERALPSPAPPPAMRAEAARDAVANAALGEDSAARARAQGERAMEAAAKRLAERGGQLSQVVVTGVGGASDRASAERRVAEPTARTLAQPQAAKSAAGAPAAAGAAPALADTAVPREVMEGCWRIYTRMAGLDTIIRDPRILGRDADSVRIEVMSGERYAWIRRERSGAFSGRVYQFRMVSPYNGTPIDCS